PSVLSQRWISTGPNAGAKNPFTESIERLSVPTKTAVAVILLTELETEGVLLDGLLSQLRAGLAAATAPHDGFCFHKKRSVASGSMFRVGKSAAADVPVDSFTGRLAEQVKSFISAVNDRLQADSRVHLIVGAHGTAARAFSTLRSPVFVSTADQSA